MLNIKSESRQTLAPGSHVVHCTSIHMLAGGQRVLANFQEESPAVSFPVQDVGSFLGVDGIAQLSYFLDALGIPEIDMEPGDTIQLDRLPVKGFLRAKDGYDNWVLQSFRRPSPQVEEPEELRSTAEIEEYGEGA